VMLTARARCRLGHNTGPPDGSILQRGQRVKGFVDNLTNGITACGIASPWIRRA
jgi:hypothetical protein